MTQPDSERPVRLYSYADDQPREGLGSLIPPRPSSRTRRATRAIPRPGARSRSFWRLGQGALFSVLALLLAGVGVTGYGMASGTQLAASPVITLVDPATNDRTPLEYGPYEVMANPAFFADTRDSFINAGLTFILIDLPARQLRYFENGVLRQSAPIAAVPAQGSWADTPSGLYRVEDKVERPFSAVNQAYLPWRLTFESNFHIHGWPTRPDGSRVGADFTGGGVRLADESAQALYREVALKTPVLVHNTREAVVDNFVYEPLVPELETAHYFIADIENGTILASSDLDDPAPIASVTKLMTAVVAAEELDLDGRVQVTTPTFVTSLIPRLADRSGVSMYSLLQLLLVESSNEAAETIAGELGREEFVAAMNAKARELGMEDTVFADPSGLSEENVSTLGDLYTLTQYIYRDRAFIFAITKNETVPSAYVGNEFAGLVNFNEIEDLDSFAGGKVGETRAAGQTSVSLHTLTIDGNERTVAVILLGSEGRTADIRALLDYVQQRYSR